MSQKCERRFEVVDLCWQDICSVRVAFSFNVNNRERKGLGIFKENVASPLGDMF